MNDYWFLCGISGKIKYAGKFDDYDAADEALDENNEEVVWLFTGQPKVETNTGGFYNLVIGDCVTVEVSGGVADVTGCPDEIEVEIIDHD